MGIPLYGSDDDHDDDARPRRRLRRGVYADESEYNEACDVDKAIAQIESVHRTRRDPLFTMESALILHGIPVWPMPTEVFTTGDLSTPGHRHEVRHSHHLVPTVFRSTIEGLSVCTVPYALAELARRRSLATSVIAIDYALHHGLCTKQDIVTALGRFGKRTRWKALRAIEAADGASESPLESLSRVQMLVLGYARPQLQALIENRLGKTIRVDFWWKEAGIVGEADGAVKYGMLADQRVGGGRGVVIAEKTREDLLRETQRVVRWGCVDATDRVRFDALLRAAGVPRAR